MQLRTTFRGFAAVRDFCPVSLLPVEQSLKIVQRLQNTKPPYAVRPAVVERMCCVLDERNCMIKLF